MARRNRGKKDRNAAAKVLMEAGWGFEDIEAVLRPAAPHPNFRPKEEGFIPDIKKRGAQWELGKVEPVDYEKDEYVVSGEGISTVESPPWD